jgi:hypothetical protein
MPLSLPEPWGGHCNAGAFRLVPGSTVQPCKNESLWSSHAAATCVKKEPTAPDGSLQRPAVHLEETCGKKNHSGQFSWDLEEEGPWVNKPSGQGPRLMIAHAMTAAGGVTQAAWVFKAAQRTGD